MGALFKIARASEMRYFWPLDNVTLPRIGHLKTHQECGDSRLAGSDDADDAGGLPGGDARGDVPESPLCR